MKVVALAAQKGGVGKTTLATNLARSFQRAGRRVLLVDCDEQRTATDWSMSAGEGEEVPTVTQQQNPTLDRTLPELGEGFDRVVIDGAAHAKGMIVSAAKVADLVLIPVQPSAADVWSAEETVEIVRARQEVTGGQPRGGLVVSRAITGTNLAEGVTGALEGFSLPVLEGTRQRVAYAEALGTGRGVQDLSPSSKAAAEIDRLTADVEDLLN